MRMRTTVGCWKAVYTHVYLPRRVNISSRLAVRATLFATLLKIGYFYCHENFTIDGQWLPDRVVKFARWQHSAMGHKGDLPGTTS